MPEIDDVPCRCPYCGKTVVGKWQRNAGMLSDPAYVLVADWLFHAECWDKQVAEHPPAAPYPEPQTEAQRVENLRSAIFDEEN